MDLQFVNPNDRFWERFEHLLYWAVVTLLVPIIIWYGCRLLAWLAVKTYEREFGDLPNSRKKIVIWDQQEKDAMSITINAPPGYKVLELGGGANRNPATTCNVDSRHVPGVDFTADFTQPLPIKSEEWDSVLSFFCLEHLPYPKIPQFLSEIHRVLKPGKMAVLACPNTEAQLRWTLEHPEGWDGNNLFESASCKLFGDQRHSEREGEANYGADSHKAYLSPAIVMDLFRDAGFVNVVIQPYGERHTDMLIQATKPGEDTSAVVEPVPATPAVEEKWRLADVPREQLYDRHYFDGGTKYGGYAPPGYRDFPCHETTARHILNRKPESVLELGCGRGYVLKRLLDAGVEGKGLDVSKHCYLTRVCQGVYIHDICNVPWPVDDKSIDLCFSIGLLDHIPEEYLPAVIAEMERTCWRGLHGIDCGPPNFDRTRCTIKPIEWWREKLPKNHEVRMQHELEQGELPPDYLLGDGKVKLNIGSFTTMFHHGWDNIDVHNLGDFAAQNKYRYRMLDVRGGLPYATSSVDLIYSCHMLEHLDYAEGLRFLRDCRRVIKGNGAMRIIVPDTALLTACYHNHLCDITGNHSDFGTAVLSDFDELNNGCADSPTAAGKLWALLAEGHKSFYDAETLCNLLKEAGFNSAQAEFRQHAKSNAPMFDEWVRTEQILAETLDMLPAISLYVDAVPS